MQESTATDRRDWDWDKDGELDAMLAEAREVVVKSGPSAGKTKVVFDFHYGINDEVVSVWETTVIKSKFRQELQARRKPEFEAGERIVITPKGKKQSANGTYRDFEIVFEHAAPKRTTAELLADEDDDEAEADQIPF